MRILHVTNTENIKCCHPRVPHYVCIVGQSSIYDNIIIIVITIVERDTRKYHEFIAEYCYECEVRVTILKVAGK